MTKATALQQIRTQNPYWTPAAKADVMEAVQVLLQDVDVPPETQEHLADHMQACQARVTTIWGQSQSWLDALGALMEVLEPQQVYDLVMAHAEHV